MVPVSLVLPKKKKTEIEIAIDVKWMLVSPVLSGKRNRRDRQQEIPVSCTTWKKKRDREIGRDVWCGRLYPPERKRKKRDREIDGRVIPGSFVLSGKKKKDFQEVSSRLHLWKK